MPLEVTFSSHRLKVDLEDEKFRRRKYGEESSKKIVQRIRDLEAAESFAVLEKLPGDWKPLVADRKGFWSAKISGGLRLLVKPGGVEAATIESLTDWRKVKIAIVEKVVDYH